MTIVAAVMGADDFEEQHQMYQDEEASGVKYLTAKDYETEVVDSSSVYKSTGRQWLITFIDETTELGELTPQLEFLAKTYQGKIRVRVYDLSKDINMKYAYECYNAPCTYFIDMEGKSYGYMGQIKDLNQTEFTWIEDQKYKVSPLKYKAPARHPDWKVHWGKFKQAGREWYDANLRATIEKPLRSLGITYCVDMDPTDYDNITSFHQKRDRQIIFLVGIIMMILESAWDMI